MTSSLLVTADDRTGALEVAGACADLGLGPVPVLPLTIAGLAVGGESGITVVDLDSRHLGPEAAARRAQVWAAAGAARALKMDSTLRGSWAAEVAATVAGRGAPAVLVAALPAVGRTCRDGTVMVHGVPVADTAAGTDPRSPVLWSRPADHLRGAGWTAVDELADADDLDAWLAARSGAGVDPDVAVCDAETDADVADLARVWARHVAAGRDVLLIGTSAVIAAGATAALGRRREPSPRPAPLPRPVVVVCGSLHPVAREQVQALRDPSPDGVEVLESPVPEHRPVAHDAALAAAAALADEAAARHPATLIVLGGDTAAALLGDARCDVLGTAAPGTPVCRPVSGPFRDVLVVTRSGGFGGPDALLELLA